MIPPLKSLTLFSVGLLLGFGVFASLQNLQSTAEEMGASALFTDVESESYYDDSVLEMVHKGIIRGYEDGRFGPHDFLTRAQATVMLQRYHHNVIRPLQRKVEFLLEHLDLGQCGDGKQDQNEQCDDGNSTDNDGCSAECLEEVAPIVPLPPETRKNCIIGGCSMQLCIEEGEEGISTCEWRPEYACYRDALCERQMDGVCGWTETEELRMCLREAGLPSKDNDTKKHACEKSEQKLSDTLRSSRACRTNDDCAVLVRGCSPYQTCGKPVNKASLDTVKQAIAEYIEECPEPQILCALCEARHALCDKGFCRLDPPIACSEEARMCPDGSSVSRNAALECDFDPCPEENCDPYVCDNGTTHPRCSDDGHVINYLVDPCQG